MSRHLVTVGVALGVWYLGWVWMALGQRIGGNPGLLELLANWDELLGLIQLSPVLLWMASTYDASLGGYAIVSIGIVVGLLRAMHTVMRLGGPPDGPRAG